MKASKIPPDELERARQLEQKPVAEPLSRALVIDDPPIRSRLTFKAEGMADRNWQAD